MKKIHGYVTSDTLKIIALVAMTVEHTGTILSGGVHPLVLLGRIAYPIFAYLIIYHLYQSGCFLKYIKRLFFFGALSMALLMPFGLTDHHVFFSFLIPVLCLYLWQKIEMSYPDGYGRWNAKTGVFILCLLASIPLNYSFLGFLYMMALYGFFVRRGLMMAVLCVVLGALLSPLNLDYALVSGAVTAFLLTVVPQDSKTHRRPHKWLFYLYYPLHLLVLKAVSFF